MATDSRTIRVALLQIKVTPTLSENLEKVKNLIQEAKQNGANLIVLPEYFNTSRSTRTLEEYYECAESIPDGPTSQTLAQAAKSNSVYVVGGTYIEKEDSNLFNTCTVWNPKGEMIAKYRKIHLFDVNIPGKMKYKESACLLPGKTPATFSIDGVNIGLGICHDLRFEELARHYKLQKCDILIYPSKFTLPTGKLHFELLQRARATDNQVFVIGVSPAKGEYGLPAWGHSQVTNPWGEVLVQAGFDEALLYGDLDLKLCHDVRQQIPLATQRQAFLQ